MDQSEQNRSSAVYIAQKIVQKFSTHIRSNRVEYAGRILAMVLADSFTIAFFTPYIRIGVAGCMNEFFIENPNYSESEDIYNTIVKFISDHMNGESTQEIEERGINKMSNSNIEKAMEFFEQQAIYNNSPLNITIENERVVLVSVRDTGSDTIIIPGFIDKYETRYANKDVLGPLAGTRYTNIIVLADLESYSKLCAGMSSTEINISILGDKCRNVSDMFIGCSQLRKVKVRQFNASKVTNMDGMFRLCSNLQEVNLCNLATHGLSNVYSTSKMFEGCSELSTVDFGKVEFSNIREMREMFSRCWRLTTVDLSRFNMSRVLLDDGIHINKIFYGCNNLRLNNLGLSDLELEKFKSICKIED